MTQSEISEPEPIHQPDPLAFSVEQAGRMLGISRDLAYDLVARGELASVRLGRRIIVPRRALEVILDTEKADPGA